MQSFTLYMIVRQAYLLCVSTQPGLFVTCITAAMHAAFNLLTHQDISYMGIEWLVLVVIPEVPYSYVISAGKI